MLCTYIDVSEASPNQVLPGTYAFFCKNPCDFQRPAEFSWQKRAKLMVNIAQ